MTKRIQKANLRRIIREEARKIAKGLMMTVDQFAEALNGGKSEKPSPGEGEVRRFVRKLNESK